ncbi:MAG: YjdJ family protein [Solibacillus sp.]
MFNYMLQIIIGLFLFAAATLIAWYEGSAIIDDSLEWNDSTPFTQLLNREIISGHEISQLDYFVYAVKFQPLFPLLMLASALYILSVTGYYLVKRGSTWGIPFCGAVGFILIGGSALIFSRATIINSLFFWFLLGSGILFIAAALLRSFQKHPVNTN